MTNLTTGDKVVLYFQPCGWFGYVTSFYCIVFQLKHFLLVCIGTILDLDSTGWRFIIVGLQCIMKIKCSRSIIFKKWI